MNRKTPPASPRHTILIEALEQRIAPAGILNESKFTSVAVGGSLLLDASGAPGTFQGLTTGSGGGSGSYLLYLVSGRALVFTTDINGNGKLDPGEITGIALGKDSLGHDPKLILFSDVNGDIATDLANTTGSNLTDSDHNPNNGNDGQLLTDTNIASITLRTLTAADLDPAIPGNTVNARLALTTFSIHGNIVAGGSVEGVTIDTSGASLLAAKFNGSVGDQLFTGANPSIGGIYTGTAANNLSFHFTQNNPFTPQIEGTFQNFRPSANETGGDILNVAAADTGTVFSIGTLAAGNGGTDARGGNISGVTMHGDTGGYELIAGNGGDGNNGGQGGSILGFNDLGTVTSQVILHTGDGGTGLLGAGGAGGVATFPEHADRGGRPRHHGPRRRRLHGRRRGRGLHVGELRHARDGDSRRQQVPGDVAQRRRRGQHPPATRRHLRARGHRLQRRRLWRRRVHLHRARPGDRGVRRRLWRPVGQRRRLQRRRLGERDPEGARRGQPHRDRRRLQRRRTPRHRGGLRRREQFQRHLCLPRPDRHGARPHQRQQLHPQPGGRPPVQLRRTRPRCRPWPTSFSTRPPARWSR